MNVKDNEKVYFGAEKVSKELKKDGVESIFTKVSENYDLMNDLMSLGMHRLWKKILVDLANIESDQIILDLAAGTGDISKKIAPMVSRKSIYMCDQNEEMIEKAKERSLMKDFIINVILMLLAQKNFHMRTIFLIKFSYLLDLEIFQTRRKVSMRSKEY